MDQQTKSFHADFFRWFLVIFFVVVGLMYWWLFDGSCHRKIFGTCLGDILNPVLYLLLGAGLIVLILSFFPRFNAHPITWRVVVKRLLIVFLLWIIFFANYPGYIMSPVAYVVATKAWQQAYLTYQCQISDERQIQTEDFSVRWDEEMCSVNPDVFLSDRAAVTDDMSIYRYFLLPRGWHDARDFVGWDSQPVAVDISFLRSSKAEMLFRQFSESKEYKECSPLNLEQGFEASECILNEPTRRNAFILAPDRGAFVWISIDNHGGTTGVAYESILSSLEFR